MSPTEAAHELSLLARDLDLVVYRLERPAEQPPEQERPRLRRELDRLRERLEDIARGLG